MRRRFRRAEAKLDFDLNIVPIIDCFTILITFLLSSGAFIAIGNLSVQISGDAPEAAEVAPPPVQLALFLDNHRGMKIRMTGAVSKTVDLRPIEGKRDLEGLKTELGLAKERWPEQKGLTLESSSELAYEELIGVMETVKKTHDDVLLGGF